MPSSSASTPKWVEVTIKVGDDRFDGAVEPDTDAVHVRLKSITDHLQIDYEGQYRKIASDPSYARIVHLLDGLKYSGPGVVRGRSRNVIREHLFLPLDHVKEYLSGLKCSRIRKVEGRTKLISFQATLVAAMERGYKNRSGNTRTETNPELALLANLIRRHYDQAVVMVGQIAEDKLREEDRVRKETERQEQQRREEKRQREKERTRQERRQREEARNREEERTRRTQSGPIPGWREVLGVNLTATWVEVKRQYRQLTMAHHPDRGGDPATMVSINLAFEKARAELGQH